MKFGEAIASGFRNYVNFRDRACRSEYWFFVLFIVLANVAIAIVEGMTGSGETGGILSTVFSLATFLPSLAIGVRRLHDIDRTGWWLLIWLIPLIGAIVIIVWACKRGTRGVNRFGPDPLALREPDAVS